MLKPGQPSRHLIDKYLPGVSESLDKEGCCCAQQDCTSVQDCLCCPVAFSCRICGYGCFCPCQDESDRLLGCGQAWLLVLVAGLILTLFLADSWQLLVGLLAPMIFCIACVVPCVQLPYCLGLEEPEHQAGGVVAACLTLTIPLTVGLVLLGVDVREGQEEGESVGSGPGAIDMSTDREFGEAWVWTIVALCLLWVCLIPCLRSRGCASAAHFCRVSVCGHWGGEG